MLIGSVLKAIPTLQASAENKWRYGAHIGNAVVECYEQDGKAIILRVRRAVDKDDSQSDFTAGVFCHTIKSAKYFIGEFA